MMRKWIEQQMDLGIGNYTLVELKALQIDAGYGQYEQIPTVEEVLDLLEGKLKNGLKLNIELKNSVFPYEGMEEKLFK